MVNAPLHSTLHMTQLLKMSLAQQDGLVTRPFRKMNAPIHILIVDDEPAVRTLLRHGFEQEGYAVSEAGSKARLLEILEREPVGLITLDLELGRENGLDLAREIRAKHNVPIMMVTGKGSRCIPRRRGSSTFASTARFPSGDGRDLVRISRLYPRLG